MPVPPHLPSYRAFLNLGTDYAGPRFIKDSVDTSKNLKAYVLIFVCATIRNIHLELLNSMETEVFLQGLRRFVSRRGTPSILVSDNAQHLSLLNKCYDLFTNINLCKGTCHISRSSRRSYYRSPPGGGILRKNDPAS